MHELSIALHIVDTLTEDLRDHPGRIVAVTVEVGALSGVVPDALCFAWDVASADSRLNGTRLQIQEIKAVARCDKCAQDRELASIETLCCPVCGEWTPELVAGRDLRIRSVEFARPSEQRAPASAGGGR